MPSSKKPASNEQVDGAKQYSAFNSSLELSNPINENNSENQSMKRLLQADYSEKA